MAVKNPIFLRMRIKWKSRENKLLTFYEGERLNTPRDRFKFCVNEKN